MRTDKLERLNPCETGLNWAKKQKSNQSAWDNCKYGLWMIWLLVELSGNEDTPSFRKIISIICEYIRETVFFESKTNILATFELLSDWANGDDTITLTEIKNNHYSYYREKGYQYPRKIEAEKVIGSLINLMHQTKVKKLDAIAVLSLFGRTLMYTMDKNYILTYIIRKLHPVAPKL